MPDAPPRETPPPEPPQGSADARFDAWRAAAAARPELWRTALGVGLAFAVWAAAVLGALAVAGAAGLGARGVLLAGFLGYGGMALGVALALRLVDRRPPASLFGPRGFRPGEAALAALLLAGAFAVAFALSATGGEPPIRAVAFAVWAAWAPLGLLAVLVQASAEEILFRGYLQQRLAARTARRLVWLWLPAVAFGALHWAPGLGAGAWVLVAAATFNGLLYGDLTARTGGPSAAIGLHVANNAFALLVVAIPGPFDALGLYRAPVDMADPRDVGAAALAGAAANLLAYAAFRRAAGRRERSLQSDRDKSI